MKATPYTDNIYYFNHKTKKKESKFDKVSRDFRYIPRADNPDKSLSRVARTLASNYDDMICKDTNKIIFVSHKFISGLTEVGIRQNNNIHKQLSDILKIKYHQSIVINGKKYRDGFTVQYTENTEIILKNPKLFYAKKSKESCQLEGNKFPPRKKKISTSKCTVNPRNKREGGTLKYGENPIEEKEEEALAYSSSFSVLSITNTKSENVKKEFLQEENMEERTLAASPFDGLAKVQQKEEIRRETNFSTIPSADEEKERRQIANNRESTAEDFVSLSHLPIFAKLCTLPLSEEKEKTPPVIIEKIEEIPEVGYNSREPDNLNQNCEMETDINSLIFKAFGRETGNQLIENCEINFIEPDKVGIKLQQGIIITNYEKEQLRSCIRTAYGENIKIISLNKSVEKPRVNKETDVQPAVETPERLELWERFKKNMLIHYLFQSQPHTFTNWFEKLKPTQILSENKLMLTGIPFSIDYIFINFQSIMEKIAIENKMTIEMYYDGEKKPIREFLPTNKRDISFLDKYPSLNLNNNKLF